MVDIEEVVNDVANADSQLTIVKQDFLLAAVHIENHNPLGSNGWRLLRRYFAHYEQNKRGLARSRPDGVLRSVYERLVAIDQPRLEGMFVDEDNIAPESFKNFVLSDVRPGEYVGIGKLTLAMYNQVAIEKELIGADA